MVTNKYIWGKVSALVLFLTAQIALAGTAKSILVTVATPVPDPVATTFELEDLFVSLVAEKDCDPEKEEGLTWINGVENQVPYADEATVKSDFNRNVLKYGKRRYLKPGWHQTNSHETIHFMRGSIPTGYSGEGEACFYIDSNRLACTKQIALLAKRIQNSVTDEIKKLSGTTFQTYLIDNTKGTRTIGEKSESFDVNSTGILDELNAYTSDNFVGIELLANGYVPPELTFGANKGSIPVVQGNTMKMVFFALAIGRELKQANDPEYKASNVRAALRLLLPRAVASTRKAIEKKVPESDTNNVALLKIFDSNQNPYADIIEDVFGECKKNLAPPAIPVPGKMPGM